MLERFSRLQVFSVHLAISLIIFAGLALAMVLHWFPGPFFAIDGGWQGMQLIAAVDLVLGPSLTLIFFSPKKKPHKQLLFDLVSIGIVQVIALVWGTWTVYNQRTVAITFSSNQFFSISHGALTEANDTLREAGKEPADIYELSDTHPRQIFVTPPPPDQLGQYLADIFNGLPEIQLRTDRYAEIQPQWDRIKEHAVDLPAFAEEHGELAEAVAELSDELDSLEFFRIKLRFGIGVAGFDTQSRELRYIYTYKPKPRPAADGEERTARKGRRPRPKRSKALRRSALASCRGWCA